MKTLTLTLLTLTTTLLTRREELGVLWSDVKSKVDIL
jgi:hypothetical protein